jgi:hypothetical protein
LRGTQEVRGSIPLSSTEGTAGTQGTRALPGRGMSMWDDDGDDLLLPREREAIVDLARNATRLIGAEQGSEAFGVIAAALRSAIIRSIQERSLSTDAPLSDRPPADPRTTRWLAEQLQRQRSVAFADPDEQEAADLLEPFLAPLRPGALRRAIASSLRHTRARVYDNCQRMVEDVAATLRHLGYLDSALTVDDLAAAFEERASALRLRE